MEHRLLAGVESPPAPKLRSFVYAHTLKHLLFTAASAFVMHASGGLRGIRMRQMTDLPTLYTVLALVGMVAFAFSLPMLLKSAWIALRHVPVDGSLKQIGGALLDALADAGLITTARERLGVRCQETLPGRFSLTLTGGTFFEASLYADSLAALLGPIDNPRYIITRKSSAPWLSRRTDYHAVPPVLSTKKEHAEALRHHWRRRVAPGELIFTRTPEGRKLLLQARVRALSTVFTAPVRRRDRWC